MSPAPEEAKVEADEIHEYGIEPLTIKTAKVPQTIGDDFGDLGEGDHDAT